MFALLFITTHGTPRRNNSGYRTSKRTEYQVSLAAPAHQTPFKGHKAHRFHIKRTMLWRRLPYFQTQNRICLVRRWFIMEEASWISF